MAQAYFETLLHLAPSDFQYPERLVPDVVIKLDQVCTLLGRRPVVLSDFRPGDSGQHGLGRAIDTTWPGLDPMLVWDTLRRVKMFSGLGVYINEKGAASFHTDTRTDRSADAPALWGGLISRPVDPDSGQVIRRTEYVAASIVLDMLKKKGLWLTVIIAGAVLWLLTRKR